jgi:electron transfer flavoprotein alpha subunit
VSGGVWVIGELDEGRLAPTTPGVATLGCHLAEQARMGAVGVLVGENLRDAGRAFAAFMPSVLCVELPGDEGWVDPADVAAAICALVEHRDPAYLVAPATPWGRTVAGSLAARLGWGILTGAQAVTWDEGPIVQTSVFRSETRVRSRFAGPHGIITVQPNITAPAPAHSGVVEHVLGDRGRAARSPTRRIARSRVAPEAGLPAPVPLESARVVVAGGAGVGSAAAWQQIEELAAALHGTVGASRPAVDRGWAPLAMQIGQTGKSIRPDLYIALGISGEILHRVGMRAARTVVAVDINPDAPIRSHADLFVLADLSEFVPALLAELRREDCEEPDAGSRVSRTWPRWPTPGSG